MSEDTLNSKKTNEFASDRFEILEKIASGGMGSIYRAKHIALDKVVALKVLSELKDNQNAFVRFHNEAKLVGKLNHSNIASVYDFGLSDEQEPFIAFEFIEGESLDQLLARKGQLSIDETLSLVRQIALALGHAHQKGIIHRDVKPGNIMLCIDSNGYRSAKIVDFGIAKSMSDESNLHVTKTGAMVGSPLYMSPEQSVSSKLTPQSDLYSLGCLMYACLVGTPPFRGNTILDTINMHRDSAPPDIAQSLPQDELGSGVAKIVSRLLEKQPERRFGSAQEVVQSIDALSHSPAETSEESQPFKLPETEGRKKENKKILVFASLGLVVSVVLVATICGAIVKEGSSDGVRLVDNEVTLPGEKVAPSGIIGIAKNSINKGERVITIVPCGAKNSDLSIFENCKQIDEINLSGNPIDDDGLKFLAKTKVIKLRLNKTNVTNLKHLPSKESLRFLELDGTRVNNDSMKELLGCPRLEVLQVNETEVTPNGVALLSSLHLSNVFLNPQPSEDMRRLVGLMPACRFNSSPSMLEGWIEELGGYRDEEKLDQVEKLCSKYIKKARDKKDPRSLTALLSWYAHFLDVYSRSKEADKYWNEAIQVGQDNHCYLELSRTYRMFVERAIFFKKPAEVERAIDQAIANLDELEYDPYRHAEELTNYGYRMLEWKMDKQAVSLFEKSMFLLKPLAAQNPPVTAQQLQQISHVDDISADKSRAIQALSGYTEVGLGVSKGMNGNETEARTHIEQGMDRLQILMGPDAGPTVSANLMTAGLAASIFEQSRDLNKALHYNEIYVTLLQKESATRKLHDGMIQRRDILMKLGRTKEARELKIPLPK